MSKIMEPPVLMSRLLTFVFAASIVVAIALIATMAKMYPLDKTQIFFLTTQPRSDLEIRLSDFTPTDENIEVYKQAFIKEYIKSRNEIISNVSVMKKKWGNTTDSTVRMWSTEDVYSAFQQTRMWVALMNDIPDFEFRCLVEFHPNAISPRARDQVTGQLNTYAVDFRYFCTNSDRQGGEKSSTMDLGKDYRIVLKLETEDTIKWTDRLHNPLGIRVLEYKVDGDDDPLDFNF